MLRHPVVQLRVTIVGNPSMKTEETVVKITDKWLPNVHELFTDLKITCNELNHRIYWRVSKNDFKAIRNYMDLKAALNLMIVPRIYVVLDEPNFISVNEKVLDEITLADDKNDSAAKVDNASRSSNTDNNVADVAADSFVIDEPLSSPPTVVKVHDYWNSPPVLSDLEILGCVVTPTESYPSNPITSSSLFEENEIIFTREYQDNDRMFKILIKGFPEPMRTVELEPFVAQPQNITKSETTTSSKTRKTR